MAADLPGTALEPSVTANLLHEFVRPLSEQSGVDIELQLREENRGKLTLATYTAALTLRSSHTIPVHEIAVRHANDAAAFIAELIEAELKPFGARVHHAAGAAVTAWQTGLDRG